MDSEYLSVSDPMDVDNEYYFHPTTSSCADLDMEHQDIEMHDFEMLDFEHPTSQTSLTQPAAPNYGSLMTFSSHSVHGGPNVNSTIISMSDNHNKPDQSSSSALILYKPIQYQNRFILPLPVEWTTASRSGTSFRSFKNLPAELRLMVWNLLAIPRTLVIDVHRSTYKVHSIMNFKHSRILKSPTPRPIRLSTNKESRQYTLTKHETIFDFVVLQSFGDFHQGSQVIAGNRIHPNERSCIYFNFAIDSLQMDSGNTDVVELLLELADPGQMIKIQRLVLNCSLGYTHHLMIKPLTGPVFIRVAWIFSSWDERLQRKTNIQFKNVIKHFNGLKEVCLRQCFGSRPNILRDSEQNAQGMKILQRYQGVRPAWSLPELKIVEVEKI